MSRLHMVVLAAALWGVGASAFAGVLYVDDDAPPGGNGRSWPTAYTYLRDALAAATAGTEIRIAQGLYRPDRTAASPGGTGSRTDCFQINNGFIVRGGYAGIGAPDPDARNIQLYETVLSGGTTSPISSAWTRTPTRSCTSTTARPEPCSRA